MRACRILVPALSAVAIIGGCGGDDDDGGTQPTPIVEIGTTGNQFDPRTRSIKVGDQVRFRISVTNHNVLFANNPPAEGNVGASRVGVPPGTVTARTFNTAGTSTFACDIHPGMSGTITVTP